MARTLSDAKRAVLLGAASDLMTQVGISAPTARIAKAAAAGRAEGTLFTYFSTKDGLLNQLFIEVETKLATAMSAPDPENVSPRERLFIVWSRLLEWGLNNTALRMTLIQLKVSERVTSEGRNRCYALLQEPRRIVEQGLVHVDLTFYIDTILFDLADITINAIAAKPSERESIKLASFELWKGSAAQFFAK